MPQWLAIFNPSFVLTPIGVERVYIIIHSLLRKTERVYANVYIFGFRIARIRIG